MAKKTTKLRPWTPTDISKLKGLAKKKVGVDKIARALKRTAGATAIKAHMLGVSFDTRGMKKPRFDLPEEQQPRNIQRADIAPANGHAMVVDGHFKTHYANAKGVNKETWILVIEGRARIGSTNTVAGDAIFVEGDRAGIEIGRDGMSDLIAYPGPDPIVSLLQDCGARTARLTDRSAVHSLKSNEIVEAQT